MAIDPRLQAYEDTRLALAQARRWEALIGKPYNGGGGGVGHAASARLAVSIYHQPYDGANNYHEAPNKETLEALAQAAKEMAPQLIARAVEIMQERKTRAAVAAAEAAREIIAEADAVPA